MTIEATLRRPDVLRDLAGHLRELLTLIDRVSWGDSGRAQCPVCGAVSVEGHVGQETQFEGEPEPAVPACWIGELREHTRITWELYRRLSSDAEAIAAELFVKE